MRVANCLATGNIFITLLSNQPPANKNNPIFTKATVTRIEPSLEAAFVDYGEGVMAFFH